MKITIFDIDNWREIGATLSRNKTRTFLTAFGIFWGTAMLAMLLGGAKGLENMLRSNFEGFATNSALLFGGRTTLPYKGFTKGTTWSVNSTDITNLRHNIPDLKSVTGVYSKGATATYGKFQKLTPIQGVDEEFSDIFLPVVYEGRYINDSDTKNEKKVCVLGKRVASDMFGTASPLGKEVAIDGIFYHVVGVAGQTSEITINNKIDESITIPLSTMRRSFNLSDEGLGTMLLARDGISPTKLLPQIERVLRKEHPIHPDDHNACFFFDISEQFKMVDNLFLGITILALFVGVGTLLAGIIGVGNIMWVIVKERTQEIGIRRAIGAKPVDIIVQILSEGMALTIIAGIAGICFATLVLFIAQQINNVTFQISFSRAMIIMVTFVILGTAAGLIPSIRAMKIKPIEAMNDK